MVATTLVRHCFTFDTATVIFISYLIRVTSQTSMQAHGEEEMFVGRKKAGWSSKPSKWQT